MKSRSVHPTYRRPKSRVASIVIGCVEALQVLFVAVDRVHLGAFHSLLAGVLITSGSSSVLSVFPISLV